MSAKKTIIRVLSVSAAVLMLVALALMCSCNTYKPLTNDEPIKLPLEKERTLSYWVAFDDTYMPDYNSYADHPFFKRLKERTNINIDFVVPSVSEITIPLMREEWMMRIASGDLPDMVSHYWFVPDFTVSIDELAEEELYYELSDYVSVQMENFNNMREEYADIDKLMYTPFNNILYIPQLTGVEDLNKTAPVTMGLVIRKDFLDELQMDVPVTLDDWHEALTAFKIQLGVESPLWIGPMDLGVGFTGDAFVSCYGNSLGLYLNEDGKVDYGMIKEGTRKYAEMMGQWYAEGLVTRGELTRAIKLSDNVGAWGGSIDDIANLAADAVNPHYEVVGAPYPVVNEGDKIDIRADYMPIGNREMNCIYVCQTCDEPALACKWIDQLFTDQSYEEASYGIEGEDFTRDADGNIKFTDSLLNADPRSPIYGVTQRLYLGSMWADRDVLVKYVYGEAVQNAVAEWSKATSERNIIRSTSIQFSQTDAEMLAQLGTGEQIFWKQFMIRDMIVNSDMSTWEEFVQTMRDIGIEEYVEIYQNGWDNYLAS